MNIHSTNYTNAFIAVAEDCPATQGEIPPPKGDLKTIAGLQYDLIKKHPYTYTSDDVLFQVYAERNDLTPSEYSAARALLFSKGQACLRASPLSKRYGWGIHSDQDGKVALYGCETKEYKKMVSDKSLQVIKAMRSSKKNRP